MTGTLNIVEISDELKDTLKKFRFQKSECTNAIILKIQRDPQTLLIEEELESCDIDELRESLPAQQPRFALVSYMMKHEDGRVSFPMCLIFYSPQGCNPEIQMLYAGSKNNLVKECGLTKNLEIRDLEELTEDFLRAKLGIK
uniref:ADF-H domain-containing protein n=1 Tax=Plectus sambesii TaxID=2011161 RepID=A0A914W149_9BILA